MEEIDQKAKTDSSTNSDAYEDDPFSQDQYEVDEITLTVDQINDLTGDPECKIGGVTTHVALKNPNTYMMATNLAGFKLIKDGKKLFYFDELPGDEEYVTQMIYIDHLDCFLMYLSSGDTIWRKDIDWNLHYKYMSFKDTSSSSFAYFRPIFEYSKINQRLIVDMRKGIGIIDLDRKQIEFEAIKETGGPSLAFKVFGELEERVISLTNDGYFQLYTLNYALKKVCSVSSSYIGDICSELEDREDPKKDRFSIAVCDKNKYAIVSRGHWQLRHYNVAVFQIRGNELVYKADLTLNYPEQHSSNDIRAISSFGYVGKHLLWIGLADREAQVYDYNTEKEELRYLEEKTVNHGDWQCYQMFRSGHQFFYGGRDGKFMRLTVNTEKYCTLI